MQLWRTAGLEEENFVGQRECGQRCAEDIIVARLTERARFDDEMNLRPSQCFVHDGCDLLRCVVALFRAVSRH